MRRNRAETVAALVGVAAVAAAAAMAVAAAAYWTNAGVGTSSTGVSTLPVPTFTKTAAEGGAVQLEWTAAKPPGSGAVEYYVKGEGGSPGNGCPTAGSPSTATGCTETGVSIGTHTYTVTAIWRSWTSTSEAKKVTVTSGPATHLVLAASRTELGAGETANLTITVRDAANNTVTSFTGAHNLVFEGASAAPSGTKPTVSSEAGATNAFGEATTIKFSEGVATVGGATNGQLTLYRVEEAHLKVREGALSNEGALVAMKVNAGPFRSFRVLPVLAEPQSGAAFEVKLTAWDEWHNVLTGYVRTHKLRYEGALNSPSGKAPEYSPVSEPSFVGGEATVSGFHFYDAAANTLKVLEETTSHEGSGVVGVKPVAAKRWAWIKATVTEGSIVPPCLFTCETTSIGHRQFFRAQAGVTDEWGNVVSNLGSVSMARVTRSSGNGRLSGNLKIEIPAAGRAESSPAAVFEYRSPGGGTNEALLHLTTESGLAFTEATANVKY